MKFEELILLLPCHSLEDFPLYHEGAQAEGLLACWTALWHPALIAAAGKTVAWRRAEDPPEDFANRLIVIPEASESLVLAGWPQRAKAGGACVVRKKHVRAEIVQAALAELDGGDGGIDPELVADFMAVGGCYLHTELLTRQMRYMSVLDETHVSGQMVAAARAAVAGDAAEARRCLKNCLEVFTEARERFYPVDCYFLDLTLVAPTTFGEALRRVLEDPVPRNLVLTGQTLEQLAAAEPENLARLREALDAGRVGLIGGEYQERELPLLPLGSIVDSLRRGQAVYERHLGRAPSVFGRRRAGLTPALPQILTRLGYVAAMHATLDDGQFPTCQQSKSRLEGLDGSSIDVLGKVPLDANDPAAFVSLPEKLGRAMDGDHVATLVFAHWPGQQSVFYEDLRRLSALGHVFGRFVTVDAYFRDTGSTGEMSRFKPDDYRSPYLPQAVIRRQGDPLSRIATHHLRVQQAESAQALATLAQALRGAPLAGWESLRDEVERTATQGESAPTLDVRLAESRETAAAALAAALPPPLAATSAAGCVVFNPLSFTRQVQVRLPAAGAAPTGAGPVKQVQSDGERHTALVEVPGLGFSWVPLARGELPAAHDSGRKDLPIVGENLLRNEFFEVWLDPQTGAVRSIRDYTHRGARLSAQLAFRLPSPRPKPGDLWRDPDAEAQYSVMAVDSVQTVENGLAAGEVTVRGNLLDLEGKRLAGFEHTLRVARGSRIIDWEIALEIAEPPRADAWGSYYAARFAWADAGASLSRSVHGGRHPTDAKRIEAPHFVEIAADSGRVAILTGGLPYHRRIGMRMLDVLLAVRGETRHRYRLGIALDCPYPLAAALDQQTPAAVVPLAAGPPGGCASGWFFHLDARHLVATHWEPWIEAERVVGYRASLLETEGRSGRAKLKSLHPVSAARQVDFQGRTLAELQVDGDAVELSFTGHEWLQIEARFTAASAPAAAAGGAPVV